VTVNNYANITQTAGTQGNGINAYNYGNGDVTLNDEAGTVVSAAEIGLGAFARSGGTGNVTVNVGADARITGGSGHGIQALDTGVGDVKVTTADGDTITAGADGIHAISEATSISEAHSIIVNAGSDTIDAGSNGISAGYHPGSNTADPNVHGNVSVTSNATITASDGYGILGFNWGTGDVTLNQGSIDQGPTGLGALANGAGTVTITDSGQISGTTGDGILVTQNGPEATGSTTITVD